MTASPVQPRVPRRVEQAAAVGRDAHLVVLAAARRRRRTWPAAGARRRRAGRRPRRRTGSARRASWSCRPADRVRSRVQVGVDRQQPLFLGVQQEHQAHHDGERAPVDLARLDRAEQRAAGLAVQPGQLADQQLHRLADLGAEGVGDLGLRLGAAREQRGQADAVRAVACCGGGSTRRAAEQAGEGAQQVALLQPQVGVEHGGRGGLAGRAWTRTHSAPLVSSASGMPRWRHRLGGLLGRGRLCLVAVGQRLAGASR